MEVFISESFHGTIHNNMITALAHFVQRKVFKKPKQATLEEAIKRTSRVFHTAQPPAVSVDVCSIPLKNHMRSGLRNIW